MVVNEPADLAGACAWAIEQTHHINSTAVTEHCDDDRLDDEVEKYNAVFTRALMQPSGDMLELVAKARLCLHDFEAQNLPFPDSVESDDLDDLAKMVMTVLREMITLCT
jgi:hypothetical protein